MGGGRGECCLSQNLDLIPKVNVLKNVKIIGDDKKSKSYFYILVSDFPPVSCFLALLPLQFYYTMLPVFSGS